MSRRNTSSTASTEPDTEMVQNVDTLVQWGDRASHDACTVVDVEVKAAAQAAATVIKRLTELEQVQAVEQLTETSRELAREMRGIVKGMVEFSKIKADINKCDADVLQIQEENVEETGDCDVWAMAHQHLDEAMIRVMEKKQAHETRRTELLQEIYQRKRNTRHFRQKLSKQDQELPEKTTEYTVLQALLHKVVEGLDGMCATLDTVTAPDGNPNAEVQAKQAPTELGEGDYGSPATASDTSQQDDASRSRSSVKVKSGDSSVVSLQQPSKRRASDSHGHISPTKRQRLSDSANTLLSSTHSDTLREGTDEDATDTMEGDNSDGDIQRASTSTDEEDDTDVSEDDNNFERIQRASKRMDKEDDTGTMEGAYSNEGIQRAITPMDEEDDTDTMEGDNSDGDIQRASTSMDEEDDTDVNEGFQRAGGTTESDDSGAQGIQDIDGSGTQDDDGSGAQGIQDNDGSGTQDDDCSKDGPTDGSQDDDEDCNADSEERLTHPIVSLCNDDNEGVAFLEEDICTPVLPPLFDPPFAAKWTLHHLADQHLPHKYLKNARAYAEGRPPLKEDKLENWRTRYNMPVPCPSDDLRIWSYNTKTPNGRTFPAYIVQPAAQCVHTMRTSDRSYYEVVTGAASTVPLILDLMIANASVTLEHLHDAANTLLLPKIHAILAPLLNLPVNAVARLPLYQSDASSDTNCSVYLLCLPDSIVFETLDDVKKMVLAPLIDTLREDPACALFFYTDQTGAKKCCVDEKLDARPIRWCSAVLGAQTKRLALLQAPNAASTTLTLRTASCDGDSGTAVQLSPIAERLQQFNERYAVTRCGCTTCVIDTQHYDSLSQRIGPIMLDKSDFLNANAAEFALGEGRKG